MKKALVALLLGGLWIVLAGCPGSGDPGSDHGSASVERPRIVIVKIGYLVPELNEMQADWIMALTPSGVDQDLERLDYRRIIRPIFPMDPKMETPGLSARRVPSSDAVSANQPEN